MRWSRFALGLLPALPAVVIALYVAIAADTPPSETDETAATAKSGSRVPGARPRPSVSRRSVTRPGATPKPGAPSPGPQGTGAVASVDPESPLGRCCAELKRYGRATTHKFRGLYAGLASKCSGAADAPTADDQEAVLESIRNSLEDQDAPFTPPSCR